MRSTLLALTCSFTLALAGCEGTASGGSLEDAIGGRTWEAETIAGKDVIDGTTVTLKIDGDRVSGKAGCNSYGGGVEISGSRITFGSLFSTKMACMASGIMEQEMRYLNALQSVTRGQMRGDTLVLSGSGGDIEFSVQ
jgi:heat shock protein HslJ